MQENTWINLRLFFAHVRNPNFNFVVMTFLSFERKNDLNQQKKDDGADDFSFWLGVENVKCFWRLLNSREKEFTLKIAPKAIKKIDYI